MATMVSPRSGFDFLKFAAAVMAFVVAVMLLGSLAMPQMAVTNAAEKAPADMDDAELQVELDRAEVDVVAAWETVKDAWVAGDQAARNATLAARQAANERYIAANDVAIARGWYSFEYTNEELAEIATSTLVLTAATAPVVMLPGLEAPVYVSWGHIKERHGFVPFDLLTNGPNHRRNCKEGGGRKTYIYKQAPGPGDTWVLGVVWDNVLVTCYQVTHDMLLWYFDKDGCPPGMNGGHDGISGAAY